MMVDVLKDDKLSNQIRNNLKYIRENRYELFQRILTEFEISGIYGINSIFL